MTIALATAWRPRGELLRLVGLLPALREVYTGIAISLPPDAGAHVADDLRQFDQVRCAVTPDWSWGRHVALETALAYPTSHVQYADLDRLLRWVETRPGEWRQIVAAIQRHDCLVIGRTEAAYRTHPQALIQTEAISNLVTSHLLGKRVDVSAGSKGFSRRAVEFLVANCQPGRALGTDAEWLVLLRRAGFEIEYIPVDGLDWESADRYQTQAAQPNDQRQAAEAYDADPMNWARRVGVALEIVQAGLEADRRYLSESTKDTKAVKEEASNYLLYKDEVYAIIGAAIEVHRQLGLGFLEPVYQEALQIELSARTISFEAQKSLEIYYKGYHLNKVYIADLVCFEHIIVELKAIDRLSGREEAQILNYLKATGLRVGLLINFGSLGRLEWKRFVL